jgi:hypothetical protein
VPFSVTESITDTSKSAGVDDSQQNYGFMAWTGGAFTAALLYTSVLKYQVASLGGNVFGTLEYQVNTSSPHIRNISDPLDADTLVLVAAKGSCELSHPRSQETGH